MGQLLTANVATSLYWLGRYLERVEGTLFEINKAYDLIIDVDKDAGKKLFKKFQVDLDYKDTDDFLSEAIRGDHTANLAVAMTQARENAIIGRSYLDEAAFGEIIALDALFKKISNSPLAVDYKDIDTALSLVSEIWGAHTKRGHRNCSDYFFKLGKLVEEIDFRLRFEKSPEMTNFIMKDINSIFKILHPDSKLKLLSYDDEDDIMESINKKMQQLIVED